MLELIVVGNGENCYLIKKNVYVTKLKVKQKSFKIPLKLLSACQLENEDTLFGYSAVDKNGNPYVIIKSEKD